MNDYHVPVSDCDSEPIHILGKIQSHGFLIAADLHSLHINYVSENIGNFVNRDAKSFLGQSLTDLDRKLVAGIPGTKFLFYLLIKPALSNKNIEALNPFLIKLDKRPFNVIVSILAEQIILEFEPSIDGTFDSYRSIGHSVSSMLSGTTLDSLLKNAAREIKDIIGYDQVMVYKFDDDGHGQVIAEQRNDNIQPFLNLKFPASDVPKQARELYKINLTRIIVDVDGCPSAIIAHPEVSVPLDLTRSELRAVSPMHIQYLENMGIGASFSISLMSKGDLWGLIACHNDHAKFIGYKARMVSRQMGQVLSAAVEFRQGEEDSEKFTKYNCFGNELAGYLENENQIMRALTKHLTHLKDITNATGVALIFEGEIAAIGQTPAKSEIAELAGWLFDTVRESIYATSALSQAFPDASEYSHLGSGILACILSRELREIIIWFKPEQIKHVTWAGDPTKTLDIVNNSQFLPRRSFENWAEIVKSSSEKWTRAEMSAAMNIREHILYLIRRNAEESSPINEKQMFAYEEPDILTPTDKHRLTKPLSQIENYIKLVSDDDLNENARTLLERMNKRADKMDFLTDAIMNFANIGRQEIHAVELDMAKMINIIKLETISCLQPKNLELTIGDTPTIHGDEALIGRVFSSVINNAVKYSANSNPSEVIVTGKLTADEVIYSISDNGIGIDISYRMHAYELFKRMDNAIEFEGAGVGLATARRIIEKHNARMWFDSELGSGTTFYLAFPK